MMKIIEIDTLYTQQLQTLFTGLFRILASAVQLGKLALDEAEFRGEEDVGSFSSALEPLSYRLFIVVVETVRFGNVELVTG